MIGLIYLLFLGGYLLLSVVVVRIAASWAKDVGHSPKRWAWVAGIVMYLILFWDLIPTHGLHQYYCATEGGLTIYETLAQWKQENSGVAETLEPIRNPPWIKRGKTTHIPLSQRFALEITTRKHPFHIREREHTVVDIETGEVLARYADFDTDVLGVERGTEARGIRDYKFWLAAGSCEMGQRMDEKIEFNGFVGDVEDMGAKE